MAAGILAEEPGGAAAGIGFSHLLVQRAVYDDLCPARRRRLHQRAAGLVDRDRALGHRVAAAAGPDDGLAGELEAAARESRRHGRTAQAAAWLAQAATLSGQPEAADRRLLDALEILVTYGEVAQAEVLAARVAAAGPDARRSWLLGTLDFLAGRTAAAEVRLREAWQAHDRARDAFAGGAAATRLAVLCLVAGRIPEAIDWGERAAAAAAAFRPPCATGPWACWRSPLLPLGGEPRAWPGWRSCPPPRPRCRGRTPTRSRCAAWPGTWPRTWPGRSPTFPPRRPGCGPGSRCAAPACA